MGDGFVKPKKCRTAGTVRPSLLKTTEVLTIMHKNKRPAQPREYTRYDFVRPADPIGAAPKAFQQRFAAEWRKVQAQHEEKADE